MGVCLLSSFLLFSTKYVRYLIAFWCMSFMSFLMLDLGQFWYIKTYPVGIKILIPGRSLPLIFCIHVRSGPIYWGGYLPCKKYYKVMVFYM
jgi:hypothetical protein